MEFLLQYKIITFYSIAQTLSKNQYNVKKYFLIYIFKRYTLEYAHFEVKAVCELFPDNMTGFALLFTAPTALIFLPFSADVF